MRVGVLLLGADEALRDALVGAVARGDDLGEVRAVESATHLAELGPATTRLAEVVDVVVGLPGPPWPGFEQLHDAAQDLLGEVPYWSVQTWHGQPGLGAALATVAGRVGLEPGDRVLLTAPDAAVVSLPADLRPFLREVAEALDAALRGTRGADAPRPTVAVDRSPPDGAVTPTAADTLGTLAEAHGAGRVVRVALAPGDGPDPAVTAAAAEHGVDLVDVSLPREVHVGLLRSALATMVRVVAQGEQA